MLFRLSLIVSLLLALLGLAACDASGYRRHGGQWQHGDDKFTPQDPARFEPLDERFARDGLHGYYRGAVVPGSDGASFVVVSENEARDRNGVYFCDTFRKGQEYWSIRHLRIRRIDGADPASYASIGKGHARDRQRVYAGGVPFTVRDPASFEPLDGGFGRDAQRGYHARTEIAGSHGPSFQTVDERDSAYARDRANVYYGDHDGDTPGEPNAAPRAGVRTLPGADPATLRVLGRGYAVDARRVWHRGRPVAGADASSFAIDESFQRPEDATDRSGAWRDGQRVEASQ